MHIFLTGGTGFIGQALARALTCSGHAVTGLARAPERAPRIDGVTWVAGDLSQEADDLALSVDARTALAAADAIAHLAAVRKDWGLSEAELRRVNVTSGVRLVEAAKTSNRILFVSSVAAYGHSVAGVATSERAAFTPSKRYGVSKVEAEQRIAEAARSASIPLTIARPGVIYGPGDTYGMVANLTRLVARGRFLRVGSGTSRLNFLYADDLARGLAATLTHDKALGEDFIFAGPEPIAVGELTATIARAVGRTVPAFGVPEWCARVAAWKLETLYRLLGIDREPFLTKAKVNLFTCDDIYDTTKARTLLEWTPTVGLNDGITRHVAWLREAGEIE